MKLYKTIIAACLLAVTSMSQAQLAGKNIILIQGFLPQHLVFPPIDNGEYDGKKYWEAFDPALNDTRTEDPTTKILYYPSNYPLQGSYPLEADMLVEQSTTSIAELITRQLESILISGHCDDSCVVITHSTGDLVMRYIMANKDSLLGTELAEKFKVSAFIDMAGAGGGTELANVGMDLVNGVNVGIDVVEALLTWVGLDIRVGINPGVLYDLQPSVARQTAILNIPAIPRLRIAGTGDEFYGFLTHPFIKGSDDSVVPLHSSCGAASGVKGFDSCTTGLRMDGRVTSVSNAPTSSELYNYHYPLILSETMAHNEMQADKDGHKMTVSLSGENDYNNSGIKTINTDVAYYEFYDIFDWLHTYRYISNSDNQNMGQVILASFD